MKNEEQTAKEKVVAFGIKNNLAMFTRGKRVISRDSLGQEKTISKSEDFDRRWRDAEKELIDKRPDYHPYESKEKRKNEI